MELQRAASVTYDITKHWQSTLSNTREVTIKTIIPVNKKCWWHQQKHKAQFSSHFSLSKA